MVPVFADPKTDFVFKRIFGVGRGAAGAVPSGAAEHKTGLAEGKIEGKRDTLLRLLAPAGIALTEHDRARIQACADAATLDRWVDNVFGAKTAAEVLA